MKATFLLTGFFPKLRLKFIYAINRKLIIFRKFHEKPKENRNKTEFRAKQF